MAHAVQSRRRKTALSDFGARFSSKFARSGLLKARWLTLS